MLLQEGFPNKSLLYSAKDTYRNSPKRHLSRVSEDTGSGSWALSPPSHGAEELGTAKVGIMAHEESSVDATQESPFEAREFQACYTFVTL